MSTIDEVITSVSALNDALVTVSSKLDVIAALVTSLEAGSIDQAKIDELAAAVSTAKTSVDAVSAKEDLIK